MTRYNEMANCHMALSTGDDSGAGKGLTAWRNADSAFILEEIIPSDLMLGWYLNGSVDLSKYIIINNNKGNA